MVIASWVTIALSLVLLSMWSLWLMVFFELNVQTMAFFGCILLVEVYFSRLQTSFVHEWHDTDLVLRNETANNELLVFQNKLVMQQNAHETRLQTLNSQSHSSTSKMDITTHV